MTPTGKLPPADNSERKRQEDETRFRERQLNLEIQKVSIEKKKLWLVGLMAPVMLAALAATPAVLTSYYQQLHRQKDIETSIILEAFKTGDYPQMKTSMRFLVEAGLISDPDGKIKERLDKVEVEKVRLGPDISWTPRPVTSGEK